MMEYDKSINRNNVCANDTVSSDYKPHLDPFRSEFKLKYWNTDIITIPLTKISRINQSQLFTVILSTNYDEYDGGYRYIFQHVSDNNEGYNSTHNSNAQCNKIIIQNRNIGKIKISDGLLTIVSTSHQSVFTSSVCEKYYEQGEKACKKCHMSMTDNDDLLGEEVNFCPYTKYKNPDIEDSSFEEIDDE